jgi:lipoprotein
MKQTRNSGNFACKFLTSPGFARLKNLLSTKRARIVTTTFAIFAATLSLCFLQNPSFASLLRTPATYLNISTSTPNVDFQFNQSELSSSAFKTNNVTVNIQTDNATGATTYISSVDEATSLVHSDSGVSDSIASISSPLLSTAFSGKTWGYRVGSLATTAFNPIPKASTPAEILNTTSATPISNSLDINFGVKVSPDLSSGTYSKQILFTTTTNYVQTNTKFLPGPAFNTILTGLNPNNDTDYLKHSPTAPANLAAARIVSVAGSEYPIYLWYEPTNKTIYWWSAADTVYMNEDASYMFSNINYGVNYMKEVDASGIDTSKTTNMSYLFYYDKPGGLHGVKTDGFNTSKVTDMSYMFSMYNYFGDQSNSPDFSTFDTSKVTNMEHMFDGSNFYHIDVSTFDTSNVTNMAVMFGYNHGTLSINVSNFNTKKVTNMIMMFSSCSSITSLDLSSFRNDAAISMAGMFYGDTSLTSLNLTGFNTEHVTNMAEMFDGMRSISNLDLTGFNTSQVTDMTQMFVGMKSIKNLNLSSFDTSKVTKMSTMFGGMDKIENLNLSSFDTRNVTDMKGMFSNTMKDVANGVLDLSSFNTQSLYNSIEMFRGSKVKTIYVSPSFTNTSIGGSTDMFINATNLVGGNGTTYSPSNPTDKTYARIDASGTPGYFTQKP